MQTDQITDPHALLNGTECQTPPTPEPASTALDEVRSLFSRRAALAPHRHVAFAETTVTKPDGSKHTTIRRVT